MKFLLLILLLLACRPAKNSLKTHDSSIIKIDSISIKVKRDSAGNVDSVRYYKSIVKASPRPKKERTWYLVLSLAAVITALILKINIK